MYNPSYALVLNVVNAAWKLVGWDPRLWERPADHNDWILGVNGTGRVELITSRIHGGSTHIYSPPSSPSFLQVFSFLHLLTPSIMSPPHSQEQTERGQCRVALEVASPLIPIGPRRNF
jgi:hypothetical protein